MKISIDTGQDSPEDIRKVIKMLQHLVGDSSYSNQGNIFSDDSSDASSDTPSTESDASSNAFSAMFGDDSPAPVSQEETSNLDEEKKEEKKLDMDSEIIPY